ncbi:MAG: efflux RND transporter periplasmic adaptor subunit [Desulfovibrio sp.]|jgi:membrane fusion protein (multidrug efflux system)|nr:efflux RND transporter periplasmic adaptor subunit [Desulfovibrio sp.]
MQTGPGKLTPAAAFLLLAAALFTAISCGGSDTETAPAPEVTWFRLTPRPATLTSELAGRTVPYTVAEVRPRVGGIILERLFEEGSEVREGDVLYRIEPSLYQAAYDRAAAALEQARAGEASAALLAARYKTAARTNAVSRQDYDNAAAAHARAVARTAAAEAVLEAAAVDLRRTAVSAPISGRTGWSSVTPGALVTGDQPDALTTVQQIDPMYVDVTQSGAELLRLRKALAAGRLKAGGPEAARVQLTLEDGSLYKNAQGEPVAGLLKFSEADVEQSTGVVTIRAIFPNPDGILLPGMYVRAVIEEGVNEQALLIPKEAVSRNNRGQLTVSVLSPGATANGGGSSGAAQTSSGSSGQSANATLPASGLYAVRTVVLNVNRIMGDHYLISGGPAAGDMIVLQGKEKIRSGKPVKGVPDPYRAGDKQAGNHS